MSVKQLIERMCLQQAVYWQCAGNNGFGTLTYHPPVEIKVRWTDKQQVVIDRNGKDVMSKAEILTVKELASDSKLWLGTLVEWNQKTPAEIALEETPIIVTKTKIPLWRSVSDFVHKVYVK